MICEKVDLYRYFNLERGEKKGGYLQTYVPHSTFELRPKIRPAVLVIPGGGYQMVSEREGEPVAFKFMLDDYCAFVLEYSVKTKYPAPLLEACLAVIYIRENAEKFHADPEKIAGIGFSAGGHLLGMLANCYSEKEIVEFLGERTSRAYLNAAIYSYAVITTGEKTHRETCETITGGDPQLKERLSIEKRIAENSPPAYIWHTLGDNVVPVENALLLAEAYRKARVPFEICLFEHGGHGLSVCSQETSNPNDEQPFFPHIAKWYELAKGWLALHGFLMKAL